MRHGSSIDCIPAASMIAAFVTMFTLSSAAVEARQSGQGAPPAAPGGDKPAEQVRKNIQVLRGLPDSQLIPVMNFFGASLGVGCPHCHVREGNNWAFEKDDRPTKKTAREMIRMVQEINKANFKGLVEVSCYTCHQGQTAPTRAVSFPLAPPAPITAQQMRPPGQQPPGTTPEQRSRPGGQPPPGGVQPGPGFPARPPLPPATEVIGKFQQAVNAPELEKLTSRVAKGTISDPQGNVLPVEVWQKPPDKFLISATTSGGVMSRATSGTTAWMSGPQGARDMRQEDVAVMRRLAGLLWPTGIEQRYSPLSSGRTEKVAGQDAYVVQATIGEKSRDRLFFDKQSGLLVRAIAITETPVGPVTDQFDFGDYREVNGVKVPFLIQHYTLDRRGDFTMKFTEVTHNVAVDDAKFAKPK
jgi:hypothetical protein